MIEKLRRAGVNFLGPASPDVPQTLVGKSIVVTGTLEGFTREGADPYAMSMEADCGSQLFSPWRVKLFVERIVECAPCEICGRWELSNFLDFIVGLVKDNIEREATSSGVAIFDSAGTGGRARN